MRRPASLNHAYRLVWDLLRQMWIPVAETSRRRGKSGRVVLLGAGVLALAGTAAALPTGGEVSAGSGSIAQSGASMTISQQSQNLAINWQDFGIGANESVTFQQPSSSAIALNRVLGQNASELLGQLNANGQVFILNPNGVLFGTNAQVSVGGLVASTLSLSDSDLLAGNFALSGNSTAGVSNAGNINAALGGYVALIGASVDNSGRITAPLGNVSLAAGQQVTLQLANGSLLGLTVDQGAVAALAANHGFIAANGGQVLLTAQAADQLARAVVNNTGVIEAQTVDSQNGVIRLLGDMQNGTVNVAGTLDASAPDGGNGGFVETSAAQVKVATGTRVSTLAADGATGTWLIDPNDYTIAASGGDIDGATLSSNLGSGNILIESSSGATAGNGDINVNDAVSWGANTLTLTAARDVNINAVMTASGSAGLALNTATANGADSAVAGGTVNVGLNSSGFTGRVDFTGGSNSLSINGTSYTILTSLGAEGSTTGTDLQGISGGLAGHYALGADIDASATSSWNSGAGFDPLGDITTQFTGIFDGLGHTIDSLTINRPSEAFGGLFGYANGATLRNIGLSNVSVTADSQAGGLLARNDAATDRISNAYSRGSVSASAGYAGGLVGWNSGSISSSYSSASVTIGASSYDAGGLVGYNYGVTGGSISDSYATGSVSAGYAAGGLVGSSNGSISNSYATGSASASADMAGGLVGISSGNISGSYASGSVSAPTNAGGLVGQAGGGSVSNSYWNTETTGQATSAAGTGLTTAQLEAALPTGFDAAVWGNGDNHTTPYLLSNVGQVWIDSDTSNTPYTLILTLDQLQAINGNLSGHYALATDLDASASSGWNSGAGFDPLGDGTTQFTGIFDGLSHNIDSLTINRPAETDVGLFGYANGATLRNIGLSNVSVTGSDNSAGLLGASVISNISNTYVTGTVSGGNLTGGLVGYSQNDIISSSYVTASVSGGDYVGGLVGGLTGPGAAVSNSYAAGSVSGGSYVGGLMGIASGTTTNSYWDTEATGQVTSAAGTGLTTAQMHQASSFSGWSLDSSGGAATTWRIYEGATGPLLKSFLTALTVTATDTTVTYNGNDQYGAGVISYSLASPDLSQVLGTTVEEQRNAGSYTLAVDSLYSTQQGYDIVSSGNATLTIDKAAITVSTSDVTKTYDATTSAAGTVVLTGGTLFGSDNLSGGSFAFTDQNAGSNKTVTVSGVTVNDGNSGANYSVNYVSNTGSTINRAALTLDAVTDTKVYDATTTSAGTVVITGLFGSDSVSSLTQSFASKNVLGANASTLNVDASYVVNDGNGGANYIVTANSATGTITAATLNLNAATDSKVYDGSTISVGTASAVGLQGSDSVNGLTQSFASKNVLGAGGSTLQVDAGYTVNDGNGGNNYSVVANSASGTITPAALTLDAVADSKVYDGSTVSFVAVAVSGLQGSDSVSSLTQSFASKNVMGSNGSTLNVDAGYVVNDGNGGANYSITANAATGTIAAASLTLNAVTDTKVYDATTSSGASVSITGLAAGDSISSLTQSFASKDVLGANGSTLNVDAGYVVNDGNGGNNYSISTTTATGTITPAALTLAAVTDAKTYDATTASAGAVNVSGLQGSDSVSSLTQSFASKNVLGTNASTLAVDAGYVVNDGNGGGNYVVSTNTATGTISAATLTLAAVSDTKTYDATTSSAGTASVSGLQGADSVSGLTQSFTSRNVLGKNGSTLAVDAGYTVNDGNSGANYSVVTTTAIGTINQALLTLAAVTDAKVYDGTTSSAASVSVSGLQGSDSVTGLIQGFDSQNVLGANGSTLVVNSGYVVNDGNSGNNYSISTTTATGTITPAAITVSTSDVTKTYDATTSAAGTAVLAGGTLFGSDALSGGSFAFADQNAGTNKTVTVSGVTVNDGNSGANYSVTYADNTSSTINQAALTLDAVADTKVYDATTSSAQAVSITGLQGSDSVTGITQSFTSKDVLGADGSTLQVDAGYTVNDGNGGGNYAITANTATGTITPAALTVTANDATRPVGAPDPAFSVRYDGFVGGEDESVLGGTLDFSSTASRSAGPGDYALTPFGLMSGNYSLTFVDGVLSVTGMTPAQLAGVATAGGFATGSGGSTGSFGSASGAGTSNGAGGSLSLADAGADANSNGNANGDTGADDGSRGSAPAGRQHRHGKHMKLAGRSLLQVQGGGMRLPDEL